MVPKLHNQPDLPDIHLTKHKPGMWLLQVLLPAKKYSKYLIPDHSMK